MEWKEMTGTVKDRAGTEIIVAPKDHAEGIWHPGIDPKIPKEKVIFRDGGWWSEAAYKVRFGS